jgi:uncharacterized protein YecE (DUF72 family)
MIRIGTSGWQYDDWRGSFYPDDLPKRRWLEFASRRFPTVEVNATFYRLPEEKAFARWREETPDGFTFSVKASRYLTHTRRLVDPGGPVVRLWERAIALGDRLGPLLFQLPPNFALDLDRLAGLLEVLPKAMAPAIEFRHPSWDRPEVYRMLDDAGAALVWADPGPMPVGRVCGGWTYLRFHRAHPNQGWEYGREQLRPWAERLASGAGDAYVYFNNDPGAAAVRDAATLTSLLTDLAPQRLSR